MIPMLYGPGTFFKKINLQSANSSIFQLIFDNIQNKNPKNEHDLTPLHFAAGKGHFDMFELIFEKKENLNIILISGVNGVGKTTTIGKIGKIFIENHNKVIFSACDTFRAAAIEQLEELSNRVGATIIKSNAGSDPASVAFKAVEYAKQNNINQVLIDTAGRLQNKKNLMEEFKKIGNVVKKSSEGAPHEVILVLDATSGQNIINQLEEFNKIIPVSGLIMTKLDGTAKGGILIALSKKYKIPIVGLGLGEKEDDLQVFNAKQFASAFTQKM